MKHLPRFIIFSLLFTGCDHSSVVFEEKEIFFRSLDDNIVLSGTLTIPKTNYPVPAVVLIHGSGPLNRNLTIGKQKPFKDLAEYLSANGIAVLRYDKRGCGESEGVYLPYDIDNFTEDGLAGINFLRTIENIDVSKIGAIGISQGGLIVPRMAISSKEITFIILLAGPGVWGKEFFYTSHLEISKAAGMKNEKIDTMRLLFDQFWDILTKKELNSAEEQTGKELLKILWSYIDKESRKDFGFLDQNIDHFFNNIYRSELLLDLYDYDPAETLRQIECPVLALNGDKDVQVVSYINLQAIEKALESGKCEKLKVIELKDHNHLFQECETGKISEYQKINSTFSETTLSIIEEWIKSL